MNFKFLEFRNLDYQFILKVLLGFFLVFPVFFQLSGGLYLSSSSLNKVRGEIGWWPIPFSALACFFGVLFYSFKIENVLKASGLYFFIFLTLILMVISSFISSDLAIKPQKWILLFQFILPMAGLIFGRLFNDRNESLILEKVFIIALTFIVPIQLFTSWEKGSMILDSDFFIFKIYGHFQYVPQTLAVVFIISLFSLFDEKKIRNLVLLIMPFMGLYVIASYSFAAIIIFFLGLLVFFLRDLILNKKINTFFLFLCFITASISLVYFNAAKIRYPQFNRFSINGEGNNILSQLPPNILERIVIWNAFLKGSIKSPKTFLFGNPNQLDINQYPSAHNFYLDFIFNFGFLAIIPFAIILTNTLMAIGRNWKMIILNRRLTGLTLSLILLVIFDNSVKVGLRQFYSGVFTYFLWGFLLFHLTPAGFVYKKTLKIYRET